MRPLPLVSVLLAGCAAFDDLTRGVALWPFVLGTDTEVEDLARARALSVVVLVAEVTDEVTLEAIPVDEAEVFVEVPEGATLDLVRVSAGLWAARPTDLAALRYRPGRTYTVGARVGDVDVEASAPAATPLDATIPVATHPPGAGLEIGLPEGYADEYDQILAQAVDAEGEVTWSDVPRDFNGWLRFAASEHTPPSVTFPGSAFPSEDALYGAAVLGVVRARDEATFSEALTSALSGFTTGSGIAMPVATGAR